MVYIRVDVNPVIATGHFARCMAIGEAIQRLGKEVTFITADQEGSNLLEQRGFSNIVLHTRWDDMESELDILTALICEEGITKLLIDSYYVTEKYLRVLSDLVETFYIDDLNEFVYPVHDLICYDCYWGKFRYSRRYKDTSLYLGVQYAPLRKEFYSCEKKNIKKEIENILVISGGIVNQDFLQELICGLGQLEFKRIDVIGGMYYGGSNDITTDSAQKTKVFMHRNVSNMKDYFDKADLVISAGGTTLYELCACGAPTISYSLADNQLDNVHWFQKEGLIEYAGDAKDDDTADRAVQLIGDYDFKERREKSLNMQKLVDGKGAERIAKILID